MTSIFLVGGYCRIHRLYLCRGGKTLPYECSRYDTKQSDGVVAVMLELCTMWSTPSLTSLPGPLWPGVVATGRVPIMGQIELSTYAKLDYLK